MNKKTAAQITEALFAEYPEPKCALTFQDPLQLLVASRLSAQCTDVRVNMVTEKLFEKYRTAADFSSADPEELGSMIFSCGLYRTKARDIIAAAKKLETLEEFPRTMEELLELPGVGRKIANLLLGELFGEKNVVIADTHCIRLSNRLGLVDSKNPHIVEKTLLEILPENTGFRFSHSLVAHGRKVCKAASPACGDCCVKEFCKEDRQALKKEKTKK